MNTLNIRDNSQIHTSKEKYEVKHRDSFFHVSDYELFFFLSLM